MLTLDKLTEIFCMADDFCKEFDLEAQKHQIETLDNLSSTKKGEYKEGKYSLNTLFL
ncbi:hypothetical protein EZS27_018198 [termite gut metagenome]|uniref:Uncharacterized protein n=1 Tax=termite gut metagenome TaxID=433724 RepID=A0A5J4RIA5_9ZZZZ